MNNYYTLRQVAVELQYRLYNTSFVQAVSFRKNRLELYFLHTESSDPVQITFSTHPKRVGIFQSIYFPPKKKDIVSFFDQLNGKFIKKIHLLGNDRLLDFNFSGELHLRFQLFGHGANCFLYDDQGKIVSAFRGERKFKGDKIPEPREPRIAPVEDLSGDAQKMMLQRDPKLPRRWVPELCRYHKLDGKSPQVVAEFTDQLSNDLCERPEAALVDGMELCTIPVDWLPADREYFDSFSEAVRVAYGAQNRKEQLDQGKKRLSSLLEAEGNRLKSRIREADNAIKALERAEQYEQYANMLMSLPEPDRVIQEQTVESPDLYGGGETVKIPVKPGISLIENANKFYSKAKDARKSAEITEGMGTEARTKLEYVNQAERELSSVSTLDALKDFQSRHHKLLEGLERSSSAGKKSRPFKVMSLDGYEVWVGRNAKSNDAILRSSHKEDLWFHSRDGAGSHVLIRMGGRKEMPDHQLIEKAAAVAAHHSKAGSASLVPVRYAKRKHLRKAKGAPAGEVKVDQEQVVLVEPKTVEQLTV